MQRVTDAPTCQVWLQTPHHRLDCNSQHAVPRNFSRHLWDLWLWRHQLQHDFAAAGPHVEAAYGAYTVYHATPPTAAHYSDFYNAVTDGRPAMTDLVTALQKVYTSDNAQLNNAAALAGNVANNRGDLAAFDATVRQLLS